MADMFSSRALTRGEARRVARHILEAGLFEEWEARVRAYNDALEALFEWLSALPADGLPESWNVYQGSELIAEEVVEAIRSMA